MVLQAKMMRVGECWHCTNRACNAQVSVQAGSQPDGANPRCTCGAPMKKKYTSPVFRYLDFLRVDQEVFAEPVPCHQERGIAHDTTLGSFATRVPKGAFVAAARRNCT